MDNKLHFETNLLIDFFKEVSLSFKKKKLLIITNFHFFKICDEIS